MLDTLDCLMHDFGVTTLPKDIPDVRYTRFRWPDRRFKLGRRVFAYLEFVRDLAEAEYIADRHLPRAPSFRAWATGR